MRILFCNYEYPPLGGGGGMINALLAEELAKEHEVFVLTSQALDQPAYREENGVRIFGAPIMARSQRSVASLASMLSFLPAGMLLGRKLLARYSFDVINTHFVLPTGPVGDMLARLAGIPNVLSLHGGDLYDPSKRMSPHRNLLLRVWISSLLRRADAVVGQSMDTLNNMRRFYTPEIGGVRIPLGIRRPQFRPSTRAEHGLRDNEVVLVTVGRLIARKGLPQLLTIMKGYKGRPVRLVVIGSGPEEEQLRALARSHGVEQQVTFTGHIAEEAKLQLLCLADIYVSTSQHEGFGLVYLEAMSAGLPIVCYDNGGQTDFLRDGETGFLVSLNNLQAFHESCSALIADAELRQEMGETSRRRVQSLYIEQCALRYEQTFRAVLNQTEEAELAVAIGAPAPLVQPRSGQYRFPQ